MDAGQAVFLKVFHLEPMRPAEIVPVHVMQFVVHLLPFVYDQPVVQPDARAVVGAHRKAIIARLERQLAGPAHGKIVVGHPVHRRRGSPVKVDLCVVAHQGRAADHVAVVEILSLPAAQAVQALPPGVGVGLAALFKVFHRNLVQALAQGEIAAVGVGQFLLVPGVHDELIVHP